MIHIVSFLAGAGMMLAFSVIFLWMVFSAIAKSHKETTDHGKAWLEPIWLKSLDNSRRQAEALEAISRKT